jgi:hypothetical protein
MVTPPTSIEAKNLMRVLRDGKPHKRAELMICLDDPLATCAHVTAGLRPIRNWLRTQGQDIVCVLRNNTLHYQQVRLLNAGG